MFKVKLKGIHFGYRTSPRPQPNRNTYSVNPTRKKKLWVDFYVT